MEAFKKKKKSAEIENKTGRNPRVAILNKNDFDC